MEIGQAAGIAAAVAALKSGGARPRLRDVSVREVQEGILAAGGYLMPYLDITPDDPRFAAVQRIGATGIMRGGRPVCRLVQRDLVQDR